MAAFVMRILGCEVTAINTVEYSNHAAYGRLRGTIATPDEITALTEGLRAARLDQFEAVVTGYMPNRQVLERVAAIVTGLKQRDRQPNQTSSPPPFWLLDPVMGDLGRLYVPDDEVAVYRSLLASADMIVPNQFELG